MGGGGRGGEGGGNENRLMLLKKFLFWLLKTCSQVLSVVEIYVTCN